METENNPAHTDVNFCFQKMPLASQFLQKILKFVQSNILIKNKLNIYSLKKRINHADIFV